MIKDTDQDADPDQDWDRRFLDAEAVAQRRILSAAASLRELKEEEMDALLDELRGLEGTFLRQADRLEETSLSAFPLQPAEPAAGSVAPALKESGASLSSFFAKVPFTEEIRAQETRLKSALEGLEKTRKSPEPKAESAAEKKEQPEMTAKTVPAPEPPRPDPSEPPAAAPAADTLQDDFKRREDDLKKALEGLSKWRQRNC